MLDHLDFLFDLSRVPNFREPHSLRDRLLAGDLDLAYEAASMLAGQFADLAAILREEEFDGGAAVAWPPRAALALATLAANHERREAANFGRAIDDVVWPLTAARAGRWASLRKWRAPSMAVLLDDLSWFLMLVVLEAPFAPLYRRLREFLDVPSGTGELEDWHPRYVGATKESDVFALATGIGVTRFGRSLVAPLKTFDLDHVEGELMQEFAAAVTFRLACGGAPPASPARPDSAPATTSLVARAVAVLHDHPDWTNKQIAAEVRCHEKHLSRMHGFRVAKAAVRAAREELPRGRKTASGDLEAY